MTEWWQVGIAVYAAIVATGALALEVRRWFEGRPSLIVTAAPGMMTYGIKGRQDGPYVMVTVTNRGNAPTTVTHLVIHEYANLWKRWRRQQGETYYISNPTIPGSAIGKLPTILEPGRLWMAAFDDDNKAREWLASGRFYVAIYATHSDSPALTRLRWKGSKLQPSGETAEATSLRVGKEESLTDRA